MFWKLCFRYLKVAEVTDNVSIFLLVTLVLQPENRRDEVRETQEFSNDGISSGDYPEDGLTTQIILRQEVHHSAWRKRRRVHKAADIPAEKKAGHLKTTGNDS